MIVWNMKKIKKIKFHQAWLDLKRFKKTMKKSVIVAIMLIIGLLAYYQYIHITNLITTIDDPDEEYIFLDPSIPLNGTKIKVGLPEGFKYRMLFRYPPYVIPPPFPYGSVITTSFVKSKFFMEELLLSKRRCIKDICQNPLNYINKYSNWKCTYSDKTCGLLDNYVVYHDKKYRRGSIDAIRNGKIAEGFNCGWNSNNEREIHQVVKPAYKGRLIYLDVPEGWSFQHFIDGILPKLVQIESYIKISKIRIYMPLPEGYESNNNNNNIIYDLLERIGINSNRLIQSRDRYSISARLLIVPCVSPPTHPYLWKRGQYLLKLPFLQPGYIDMDDKIVYFSRNRGTNHMERRVLNEKDVLSTIRQVMTSDSMLELVEFYSDNYNLNQTIDLLSHAKLLIGPHGGALYNMIFAHPGTAVIEFLPDEYYFMSEPVHSINYVQAMTLGHRYYALMCQCNKSMNDENGNENGIEGDNNNNININDGDLNGGGGGWGFSYDMTVDLTHLKMAVEQALR